MGGRGSAGSRGGGSGMKVGTVFKKTSGIKYQVVRTSENLVITKQLGGAGKGREVVFNKAQIQENIDNKKFRIIQ